MYILIDGENIDATLGVNILKRAPRAEERPRWDRVLYFNPFANDDAAAGSDSERSSASADADSADIAPEDPQFTPQIRGFITRRDEDSANADGAATGETSGHETDGREPSDESDVEVTNSIVVPKPSGLFFLNASQRSATAFVQALLAIGWRPVQLTTDEPERKIVDEGIQRTLEAIAKAKPGADVVIGTHDVDYLPQIEQLLDNGHRVAVICFREYLSTQLAELEERGLEIVDLEFDVRAFNLPLNRTHPVDIDDFDPFIYL